MARLSRTVVLVIFLTAAAGAVGGWAGVRYALATSHTHSGLDELVHEKLDLSESQTSAIEEIETGFAERRKVLETEMRAANRELAAAVRKEPEFGEPARAAIMRFHAAESALQQETVMHVLAMRRVLTPDQARQFDEEISRSLTAE
jgi:Spy/CpxP family protein refolding chaperone